MTQRDFNGIIYTDRGAVFISNAASGCGAVLHCMKGTTAEEQNFPQILYLDALVNNCVSVTAQAVECLFLMNFYLQRCSGGLLRFMYTNLL